MLRQHHVSGRDFSLLASLTLFVAATQSTFVSQVIDICDQAYDEYVETVASTRANYPESFQEVIDFSGLSQSIKDAIRVRCLQILNRLEHHDLRVEEILQGAPSSARQDVVVVDFRNNLNGAIEACKVQIERLE